VFAAAGGTIFAGLSGATGAASFSSGARSTSIAGATGTAGSAILASIAGLSSCARGSGFAVGSSRAWWAGFRAGSFAGITLRACGSSVSGSAGWAGRAAWSLVSGFAIATSGSGISGASVVSFRSGGASITRGSGASALIGNTARQFRSRGSWCTAISGFALESVDAVVAVVSGSAGGTVGSAMARAALAQTAAAGLRQGFFGDGLLVLGDSAGPVLQTGRGAFLGRRATSASVVGHGVEEVTVALFAAQRLDVEHFAPHVARTSLAEVEFNLHRGFQSLYVMEDQGEGQQASGDGHRAEDDGGECDHTRRPASLFVTHSLFLFLEETFR